MRTWRSEHPSVCSGARFATAGVEWLAALDTLVGVSAEGRDLYYRVDGHLNVAGDEVLANFVADRLFALSTQGHASTQTSSGSCWAPWLRP